MVIMLAVVGERLCGMRLFRSASLFLPRMGRFFHQIRGSLYEFFKSQRHLRRHML